MISLTSSPDGAQINVDNSFVGNTPATLKLKPGQHSIRMFMTGYNNWVQWITVEAGSEVHLTATLQRSNVAAQVSAQASAQASMPPASAAPLYGESIPSGNAVLFVSPQIGGKSLGFFRAPDGTAAAVPVSEVKEAMEAGYTPVTVAEMTQVIDNYVKTIQDQQKRLNDLASDYNALAQRFNRLATINATAPAVTYAPSQNNDDERRAMRLMLFQSLLSRTAPQPGPIRVQVTDCTAYPALCVH
jgi:hypothetical protein